MYLLFISLYYFNYISISAPGIVFSLNVSNLTSTSAVIAWNKPTLRNGILRRYDVWIELPELSPSCVARKTFKCSLDKCQDIKLNASDEVSFIYLCLYVPIPVFSTPVKG